MPSHGFFEADTFHTRYSSKAISTMCSTAYRRAGNLFSSCMTDIRSLKHFRCRKPDEPEVEKLPCMPSQHRFVCHTFMAARPDRRPLLGLPLSLLCLRLFLRQKVPARVTLVLPFWLDSLAYDYQQPAPLLQYLRVIVFSKGSVRRLGYKFVL